MMLTLKPKSQFVLFSLITGIVAAVLLAFQPAWAQTAPNAQGTATGDTNTNATAAAIEGLRTAALEALGESADLDDEGAHVTATAIDEATLELVRAIVPPALAAQGDIGPSQLSSTLLRRTSLRQPAYLRRLGVYLDEEWGEHNLLAATRQVLTVLGSQHESTALIVPVASLLSAATEATQEHQAANRAIYRAIRQFYTSLTITTEGR